MSQGNPLMSTQSVGSDRDSEGTVDSIPYGSSQTNTDSALPPLSGQNPADDPPNPPTNTLAGPAATSLVRSQQRSSPLQPSFKPEPLANPVGHFERSMSVQAPTSSSAAFKIAKVPQKTGPMYLFREPVWQDGNIRALSFRILQELQAFCIFNNTVDLPCARKIWTGGNTVVRTGGKSEIPRYRRWQTTESGEKLKVGRFRYGFEKQLIVVQAEKDSKWQQGNAVIIVHTGKMDIWKIWRGQRDLNEIPEEDAVVECVFGEPVLRSARSRPSFDSPQGYNENTTKPRSSQFMPSAHQGQTVVKIQDSPQSRQESPSIRERRRGFSVAVQKIHTLYEHPKTSNSITDCSLPSAGTGMTTTVEAFMGQDGRQIKAASEERRNSNDIKQDSLSTKPSSNKKRESSSSSDSDEPIARKKLPEKRAKLTDAKTDSVSGHVNHAGTLIDDDVSTNALFPLDWTRGMLQQAAATARPFSGGSPTPVNSKLIDTVPTSVFESVSAVTRPTQQSSQSALTKIMDRTPPINSRSSIGPPFSIQSLYRANSHLTDSDTQTDFDTTFFFVNASNAIALESPFSEVRDINRLFARARVARIITRDALLLEANVGGEEMLVQKGIQKDFDRLKDEIVKVAVSEVVITNAG